jgi:hypothetical protein
MSDRIVRAAKEAVVRMVCQSRRRGHKLAGLILLMLLGVRADLAMGGQLTATWLSNSSEELGFSVERSPGTTDAFAEVGLTDSGITSYTDTTVEDSATYCYRVRAFDTTAYSDYSNIACATAGPRVNVAVIELGSGEGTVISTPPGIMCGSICSDAYAPGTVVVLTATPAAGSTFAGWHGGGCSGTGSCVAALTQATTVTATFELVDSSLATLVVDRSGKGLVTSLPPGISCGRRCRATFSSDTTVTLRAIPSTGSRFMGWSGGGCSGTNSCIVTVSEATAVSAVFTRK